MKNKIEQVLVWADDRRILSNGKKTTQMLKLGSEFGELCGNLANNKPIKDDIGDCLVVCIILCHMNNTHFLDMLESEDIVKHTTPMVPQASYYLGQMMDNSIKAEDYSINMANFIHQLEGIALVRHTSLSECLDIAYEDIKDRTGILNSEGNFIKSTDEAYAKALEVENERTTNTE